MANRSEVLYADFSARLMPRLLWDAMDGTAIRATFPNGDSFYAAKPTVRPNSGTRKLTEAEDNAVGRALARRANRKLRGWLPYAKR